MGGFLIPEGPGGERVGFFLPLTTSSPAPPQPADRAGTRGVPCSRGGKLRLERRGRLQKPQILFVIACGEEGEVRCHRKGVPASIPSREESSWGAHQPVSLERGVGVRDFPALPRGPLRGDLPLFLPVSCLPLAQSGARRVVFRGVALACSPSTPESNQQLPPPPPVAPRAPGESGKAAKEDTEAWVPVAPPPRRPPAPPRAPPLCAPPRAGGGKAPRPRPPPCPRRHSLHGRWTRLVQSCPPGSAPQVSGAPGPRREAGAEG